MSQQGSESSFKKVCARPYMCISIMCKFCEACACMCVCLHVVLMFLSVLLGLHLYVCIAEHSVLLCVCVCICCFKDLFILRQRKRDRKQEVFHPLSGPVQSQEPGTTS